MTLTNRFGIRSIITAAMLFLALNISCADREIVPEDADPKEDTPGDNVKDTESWVYRINPATRRNEKFFGLVHYNLPGYNHHREPDPDGSNEAVFKEKTRYVNTIILDNKFVKPYMFDKVLIISNYLRFRIEVYLGNQNLPDGADKDYYGTQFLKKNQHNPELISAIDYGVDYLKTTFGNFDMEYNTIDEIGLGGMGHYFTPPSVGAKIYERIRLKEWEPLVLVDLLGHGRGSAYFFEQRYLKDHDAMPKDPPYELLGNNARANTTIPLLGFFEAYDGTPVYDFDSHGKYSYHNIDLESYKKMWFENVKQIAAAYKNSGNLFSLNAYNDFFKYPILSGITVDAIKAGVGDMPVWLYFDGNGYSKPAGMSPGDYVNELKCQIYTSIVHGATGVLFWSTTTKEPDVFDALTPLLKELNENVPIFKMNTVEIRITNDLHVMMKESAGKKYIIATNTSKTSPASLNMTGVDKKSLNPLEVYIAEM